MVFSVDLKGSCWQCLAQMPWLQLSKIIDVYNSPPPNLFGHGFDIQAVIATSDEAGLCFLQIIFYYQLLYLNGI